MNAPAKIVPKSKLSEWRGLDRIGGVVHAMRCIWREQEKDDIGIDGEIELCRPRTDGDGLVGTGKIVKVQSKSGSSYVVRDTDDAFASPTTEKDLIYWRDLNVPVVFIVYHPDDDRLYWKDVKAYLKERPDALTPPHRIEFDKSADRFDENAYAALCALCDTAPERVSLEHGEPLYTNLLEVLDLPERIWVTPVLPEKRPRFHDRLAGVIPPYVFKNGNVITLTDPTASPTALAEVVENCPEDYGLDDWLGQDDDAENDLRALLNGLLHRHLRHIGLACTKKPRRYFFAKGLAEDSPISRRWTSSRTRRTQPRTVSKFYEYGKLRFYRHHSLEARFDRMGDTWVVVLDPRLHFTLDGEKPWEGEKAKSFAIRARAEQYNDVYLNNVLFWAHQLSRGDERFWLSSWDEDIVRISGSPITVEAPFSIRSTPAKPSRD
jgi:hypothetical protein